MLVNEFDRFKLMKFITQTCIPSITKDYLLKQAKKSLTLLYPRRHEETLKPQHVIKNTPVIMQQWETTYLVSGRWSKILSLVKGNRCVHAGGGGWWCVEDQE